MNMRTKNLVMTAFLCLIACWCASCEKMVVEEEEGSTPTSVKKNGNLILRVTNNTVPEYETSTRAVQDITDYCTRFNFVLYQNGTKVKGVSQEKEKAGDEFGEVAMTVEPGTYQLLVLAHCGNTGNPSLSDPENIKFNNTETGYSDTFYYYGDIEVTSESKTHDIQLTRATTMVQFVFDEDMPSDIYRIRIDYTGGSGVLNAKTGYGGSVNSQQYLKWNVSSHAGKHDLFKLAIYTFLQHEQGNLHVKITAMTENDEVILQREYDEVPVERNKKTVFQGNFFTAESNQDFSFTAETGWEVLTTLNY